MIIDHYQIKIREKGGITMSKEIPLTQMTTAAG